jgi:hypothetical protein
MHVWNIYANFQNRKWTHIDKKNLKWLFKRILTNNMTTMGHNISVISDMKKISSENIWPLDPRFCYSD